MSATNKTTYFELPIFIGTDTPSWLGDWNNAMTKIDTAINNVKTSADNAASTANSASSKSDVNTESIAAMNTELQTLKEAVQNYDAILDFNNAPVAIQANNIKTASGYALLVRNTNKTLNKISFSGWLTNLSNPVSYTMTTASGNQTFFELFTVEDNAFNLQQGSLPNTTTQTTMTLGYGSFRRDISSEHDGTSYQTQSTAVIAWFDGATTHIGLPFSSAISNFHENDAIWFTLPVFLTGSVYNPVNPGDGN